MSREWKPGDVALVRGRGMGPVIALRGATGAWVWVDTSGKNPQGPGQACYAHESGVSEARPLVVIDPEDAEQVERLLTLVDEWASQVPYEDMRKPGDLTSETALAAALREFANPTPPPRCPAHGDEACALCSRITDDYLDDGACRHCEFYVSTGMHWDTCPGRIRGRIYADRDAARSAS